MRRVLQVVLGVVIFAYAVNFLGSGRNVPDPREIDPDEITPPGTEFRIGEEAFVPHRDTRRDRDRDGIIAITVTSIEEGDQDLFQRRVENSEGWVPYHIRATVENVSQEDLGTAVFSLDLVLPDGEPPGFSVLGGDIRRPGLGDCRAQNFPTYAELGTIVETCELSGVREGEVAAGVRWTGPVMDEDNPYQDDPRNLAIHAADLR